MNKNVLWVILIIVGVVVIYFIYRKNFKRLKPPCVCLITGGVKTGKSLLAVKLSMKDYRSRHRKWWIKTHIFKQDCEEPLYYTNVWVSFNRKKAKKPHKLNKNIVLIELEHLNRSKRFNYASVVYICESSLMSDNQDFNNARRNAELSMFNKLFGHETKGGVLYYDTQSPLDNHYSIKRVMSTFFFIQKSLNLFLFRILYVREFVNTDLGENNFTDDVDTTTRKVLIGRWWYHRYDRYYFSYLTDELNHDSSDIEFYKGGLNSFNPLYRELSLKHVETDTRKEGDEDEKEKKDIISN